MVLPPLAKGYLLMEGAQLPLQGAQNLRTLCAGDWSEAVVARALRNMDVAGEPFAKTFWEGDMVTGEDGPPGEKESEVDPEELAALDLDEEEAAKVFAVLEQRRRTWSENKRLKQALRKDRSGAMSSSSSTTLHHPSGGAAAAPSTRGSGRKRISIAELK